jgi:4-amino-4-deoxy-L-arabinose transferase-like glycosyltransferase
MLVEGNSTFPLRRPTRSAGRLRVLFWLLALTALLRVPVLVNPPFNIDESYYAAGAAELVSGGAFYRDVVDHKPPGIYLIYALIYLVAGTYNQTAVHIALVVVSALTAFLVGLIAQELFGARVGLWAGTLYAVTSVVGPANDFQAANTELFMNLPVVAALWLCARLWVRQRLPRSEAVAMGLLVGMAMLIRPQAAVAFVPIGVALYRRKAGWGALALVAGAAVLPVIGLLGWLYHADAIADLRTSLAYASYYTRSLPIDVGVVIPAVMLMTQGRRHDLIWRQGAGCLLVSWLVASFVAVGMGGRFYPHYFIQVLPPLAIMAARQLSHWYKEGKQ